MSDDQVPGPDLQSLLVEAHELNIQYTGDDAVELHAIVTMARSEAGRNHPVPCYGLSFDPTNRRCRICQLRNPCADLDQRPRVDVLEAKLQPIPCESCGKGMLEIECLDEAGTLRDYGCTTIGCQNSVAVQCGWESVGGQVVREVVLGEPEEKPEKEVAPKVIDVEPEESPKPKLRVVAGGKKSKGQAKKKAPPKKKVVVKKKAPTKQVAVKKKTPAKKKVTVKKKASAKKQVSVKKAAPANSGDGLKFSHEGDVYNSLTTAINEITQSRNWSPVKFFKGQDTKAPKVGDVFERTWKGRVIQVEVISA
jgi:hypothetical protein